MSLEEEIKQYKFENELHKATINLIFTGNWAYSTINSILKPYNLSPEQFNALRILRGRYPEPSSIMLLNERMLDKMSNVSRIVEKLRLKGLVVREECPSDRRQVDITLTPEGLDVLKRIDKEVNIGKEVAKNITASEAATLNQILDKLRG